MHNFFDKEVLNSFLKNNQSHDINFTFDRATKLIT